MSIFDNTKPSSQERQPRRLAIYLIPLALFLLLGGSFAWSAREALLPRQKVEVISVRLANTAPTANEEGALFQAAGWIEAAPYPISVTALVSGIVEKIFVIGGQNVKKNQLLAQLVDDDLLLEKRRFESRINIHKARIKSQQAIVEAKLADLEQLDYEIETAKARQDRLQYLADTYKAAGEAIPLIQRKEAALKVIEQQKTLAEYNGRKKIQAAAITIARSALEEINSLIEQEEVALAKVELDISRLQIKAPIDGRIQQLYAREGRKQMLGSDKEMSTTVALMYDPKEMQIRVDVPLADAGHIKVGQKSRIRLEISKEILEGKVTIISGHADFQKNTLEVKVKILNPPDILRPEMLAQVEFLADTSSSDAQEENQQALFVRRDCLSNKEAWVVDTTGKLEKRSLETDGSEKNWIHIKSGLSAGERVILNPGRHELQAGRKVNIVKHHE